MEVNQQGVNTPQEKKQAIDELMAYIQNMPVHKGSKEPYIHLEAIISEAGISQQDAYDLLEAHGLRGCRGKWDDQLTDFGYVFTHEFYGVHAEKQVERFYSYELVSPHGAYFFREFFKLAKERTLLAYFRHLILRSFHFH